MLEQAIHENEKVDDGEESQMEKGEIGEEEELIDVTGKYNGQLEST